MLWGFGVLLFGFGSLLGFDGINGLDGGERRFLLFGLDIVEQIAEDARDEFVLLGGEQGFAGALVDEIKVGFELLTGEREFDGKHDFGGWWLVVSDECD